MIFWYRVYAAVMLFGSLGLLAVAALVAWAQTRPEVAMLRGAAQAQTQAMVLVLFAAIAVGFYGTATFMPLKPWAWTFGLIVIALGVPSVTIVVCLPMFFAWMKPSVKAAFCRL